MKLSIYELIIIAVALALLLIGAATLRGTS